MIKVRTIQAIIQVMRPVAWSKGRIRGLAIELKCIELLLGQLKVALRRSEA